MLIEPTIWFAKTESDDERLTCSEFVRERAASPARHRQTGRSLDVLVGYITQEQSILRFRLLMISPVSARLSLFLDARRFQGGANETRHRGHWGIQQVERTALALQSRATFGQGYPPAARIDEFWTLQQELHKPSLRPNSSSHYLSLGDELTSTRTFR